ncbi:hypothetical protein [Stenotrophomonas sp.]|uniref:hypothetical protein n=1 Tax=Stenotrophomonas sp. TaxID=69392 RepID=UPI0028B136C5|nr:hypothetical protein [Stenotrophomonas sp.]
MATAGSIVVDLLMRTGSFETDSKAAEKRMKQFSQEATDAGTAIGLAFAGAATVMTAMVKTSIDAMDELSKTAKVLGVSTEEFSKLSYAAGFADLSIQDLQGAFGKLTKAQVEALDAGSKQAKIFDALGISIQDAKGNLKPTTDLLYDFADAFQRQKGSQEVVAAGMAIFGKNFQSMIDLLKDGSQGLRDAGAEAQAFGHVLSSDAGAMAEEFNDNLARMKLFVTGVGNAVAADLLPDLERLSSQFLDSARSGQAVEETAQGITDVIRVLGGAFEFAMKPIKAIDDLIQGLTIGMIGLREAAAGVIDLNWSRIKNGWEVANNGADLAYYGRDVVGPDGRGVQPVVPKVNFIDPSELLAQDKKAVEDMRRARAEADRLRKLAFGDSPSSKGSGSKGKSDAEKSAERLGEAFRSANDQLERQIALYGDTSELSRVNYEIQSGALKGIDADMQAVVRSSASYLDILKSMDEVDAYQAEDAQKLADAFASMFGIDGESSSAVEGFFGQMSTFAEQAARNIQTYLGDSMYNVLDGNFTSIGDSFVDMLKRMTAELAASKMLQMLGDGLSGYTGKGAGWINALGGLIQGQGGRAGGGPVAGDSIYRVGEGGRPELFQQGGKSYLIPGDAGSVRPITASLPSSGPVGVAGVGMQVEVNITNESGTQMQADASSVRFDGRKMIVGVVARAIASGELQSPLEQAYGLRRQGRPGG